MLYSELVYYTGLYTKEKKDEINQSKTRTKIKKKLEK